MFSKIDPTIELTENYGAVTFARTHNRHAVLLIETYVEGQYDFLKAHFLPVTVEVLRGGDVGRYLYGQAGCWNRFWNSIEEGRVYFNGYDIPEDVDETELEKILYTKRKKEDSENLFRFNLVKEATRSWQKPMSLIDEMAKSIRHDRDINPPKFQFRGNPDNVVFTSNGKRGHNCTSWAISKLELLKLTVGEDEKADIRLGWWARDGLILDPTYDPNDFLPIRRLRK